MDKQTYISLAEGFRRMALSKAKQFYQDETEAEDVAQEVLLKMWERHEELDLDPKRLHAYITTLTRNICLDRQKMKRRHPVMRLIKRHSDHDDNIPPDIHSDDTPQSRMEDEEATDIFQKAFARLPHHWAEMLRMRMEQEMTYEDIAHLFGTSESSIRGTLSKAKNKLLELIKRQMQ